MAPPAQGAFIASIGAPSPAQQDKFCPVTTLTFDVPEIREMDQTQVLDKDTYLHKAVDGESSRTVSCSVKSSDSGSTFSGKISTKVRNLEISSGTLGADKKGTARIILGNSAQLSSPLASQAANCTVTASEPNTNYQVKNGSMWASFKCMGVESPPSQYCAAEGTFVLENCDQ